MKILLRPATINDIPILKHWDSQPHVLKARNLTEPDADWIWEVELNRTVYWRELLIGEVDGQPVAFLQIIDAKEEEAHYWGNVPPNQMAIDIWIGEKKHLNKGYGTVIMQLALDRCFENKPVTSVLIDPLEENKSAHRFYERFGFRFVEQRMFGEDSCFVYRLNRSGWEASAEH